MATALATGSRTEANTFLKECFDTQKIDSASKQSFLAARAAVDARDFLQGYPNACRAAPQFPNVKFFLDAGKMNDEMTRSTFLSTKRNDMQYLEFAHNYIQWLFPIREQGMNAEALPLQPHELAVVTRHRALFQPLLLEHYTVLLAFYGLRLVSRSTGEVTRSEDWRPRFANLNARAHNYLRITRILKCLHEFGLTRFQAPLVWHFIKEVFLTQTLPNCESSAQYFWCAVVADPVARSQLTDLAAAFASFRARSPARKLSASCLVALLSAPLSALRPLKHGCWVLACEPVEEAAASTTTPAATPTEAAIDRAEVAGGDTSTAAASVGASVQSNHSTDAGSASNANAATAAASNAVPLPAPGSPAADVVARVLADVRGFMKTGALVGSAGEDDSDDGSA